MKTLREIYFDAADLIERRGLAKGCWQDHDRRLCMGAAVMISAFGKLVTSPEATVRIFTPLYTMGYIHTQFNDAYSTTAADVSARLRELAANLPGDPECQTDISTFTELLDRENKKQRAPLSLTVT